MAEASKASSSGFLGSISPWMRSSTPPPRSPRQQPKQEDNSLKQSDGNDHSISLRPTPSLRRYPRDCPPLKTRWFYAVDVVKRKNVAPVAPNDRPKPSTPPKKWVSFSSSDSSAIETAFQALDRDDEPNEDTPTSQTVTKVPVNEDYLFDVHIEQRELEPAYWLGPVYEVRRGSWFYTDGLPCDENLARQLEEGYLKVAPWRRGGYTRATSQSRSSLAIIDSAFSSKPIDATNPNEAPLSNTTRLFGAHMNTTVTYQDATTAYLSADDFMSRIGSSVYTRFGAQSGTRLVRGFSEQTKAADGKPVEAKDKTKSSKTSATSQDDNSKTTAVEPITPRRSLLERQLSSLAGLTQPEPKVDEQLEEEDARIAQEQEMEESREKDGDDQGRQIDHLILVTHGIGQRLGLRLDSINFIHDVNTMRKTMKAVFGLAPDLQSMTGSSKNCTIQVLPVCWRHLLDFPKQSLKQNRKEFDLADLDAVLEDDYPSLQDITVEGVPAVRNLITDLAMDVLLYQSAYREHIASIVQKEANRIFALYQKRTGFTGKVSLCGHSLGSAILFDILCRQGDSKLNRPRRVSSKSSRDPNGYQNELKFDFDTESFFALGSPVALFQMLKGRTIAGRSVLHDKAPVTSPFDLDAPSQDPFLSASRYALPITVSSPKCKELYNIFHPTDPIAYRMEPLISPAMAQLKSQQLPYVKRGLFGAPGIANMTARVGQQVMSSWYSITSGVASSLINRSLGITGEEQALPQDKTKSAVTTVPHLTTAVAGNSNGSAIPHTPVVNIQKQQELANSAREPGQPQTLIDTEIETLSSSYQRSKAQSTQPATTASSMTSAAAVVRAHKRNLSSSSSSSIASTGDPPQFISITVPPGTGGSTTDDEEVSFNESEKSRRLRREEAKVRALNSNGRVDYHIQEGLFDVSLLASIASHLSYWADEDVTHFMIGELLKKTNKENGGIGSREKDKSRMSTT